MTLGKKKLNEAFEFSLWQYNLFLGFEENLHGLQNINFSQGQYNKASLVATLSQQATSYCFILTDLLTGPSMGIFKHRLVILSGEGTQGTMYSVVTWKPKLYSQHSQDSRLGHFVRDLYVTHEPSQSFATTNGFSSPLKRGVDILSSAAAQ